MHDDTNNNAHASDTTPPRKPPANLSEAEFLDREAEDAKGAISGTIERMRDSVKDAADVRAWARAYPWATLGASLAAGFVAARVLMPKKRAKDEEREPALLERILTDEKIAQRLRELAEEDDAKASEESPVHTLVSTLLKTFGPAVQSAVASALAARASQPAPDAPPEHHPDDQPSEGEACPPQ